MDDDESDDEAVFSPEIRQQVRKACGQTMTFSKVRAWIREQRFLALSIPPVMCLC